MKKVILTLGAVLFVAGCAKDAKGKITVPEIYRLHLLSDGDFDHRDIWINVDA